MAKVSIIIPIYNVDKYLDTCIESVRNQSLEDLEIICIDDYSTDQSLEVLRRHQIDDQRITVIENAKNLGQSYSRNVGIQKATGEYIYFLDSDDFIEHDAMEKLYSYAKSRSLEVIFFDAQLIFESETLEKKFVTYQSERSHTYEEGSGEKLFQKFIENNEWSASPPRQFWSKNFIDSIELSFWEGIIHEDELFSFIGILEAKKTACIKQRYFIRRLREGSTMTMKQEAYRLESILVVYRQVLEYWLTHHFMEKTNEAIHKYLMKLAGQIKRLSMHTELLKDEVILQHMHTLISLNGIDEHAYERLLYQVKKQCQAYEQIILYGTGQMAEEILHLFNRHDISVSKVVVSAKTNEKRYFYGHQIHTCQQIKELAATSLVVIATSKKYHQDIIKHIHQYGFFNYIKA